MDDKTNPETYVIKHGKDYTPLEYDATLIKPVIIAHIASLYATVDQPNHEPEWSEHFTENVRFKKNASRCNSRAEALAANRLGWSIIAEREHTVYQIYSLKPGGDAVMFHGRSNNLFKDGRKTTFTWAARMKFEHVAKDKVLISEYTIIPDYDP